MTCIVSRNKALMDVTWLSLFSLTELHLIASHYLDYFVYPGSILHLLSEGLACSLEPRNSCCLSNSYYGSKIGIMRVRRKNKGQSNKL